MLTEIFIENFAIIDSLHVQFSNGLNIVTGETGAGKSIMVDALMVALGGRAYADFIRAGAEKAVVEAIFMVNHASAAGQKALEYGFLETTSPEGELLIRREIARNGRNRILVNGHPATGAMVLELGDLLLDIHGQHEHQSILNPEYHVELLDSYGKLLSARDEVAAAYRRFKKVERELKELRDSSREKMQHLDLLRFQQQEIANARLQLAEDEQLAQERKILAGAEQLAAGAGLIHDVLYGEQGSALEKLGAATRRLEDLAKIDEALATHAKTCETVQYQLEDVAFVMRDYAQAVEFDPYRLEEVEKRLDEIATLKRKYGNSIAEILAFYAEISEELTSFDARETRTAELEKKYASARQELQQLADTLSRDRQHVAKTFAQQVMAELALLGMERTRFQVEFKTAGTDAHPFTAQGIDKIEFLIAPNPGEPLKPLSKIASGGEISRIMLALKTLLGEVDRVPTMIFDEIDTGIGGKIAEVVGRKLEQVAAAHQVVCITHLPQIASKGATHFHVAKQAEENQTRTFIRQLTPAERLHEIARMLGGENLTQTTLQHAREMLGERAVSGKNSEVLKTSEF